MFWGKNNFLTLKLSLTIFLSDSNSGEADHDWGSQGKDMNKCIAQWRAEYLGS